MASYNRVILIGNITRDIELKYVRSDLAVTEIGLAVNDRRKSQTGEWVDETTFVDVTLWGRTAEIASQYLGKGSQAMIEGRLKLDTWETEGQKRSKLRVIGEKLVMLGARSGNGGGGGRPPVGAEFDEAEAAGSSAPAPAARAAAAAPPPDDIPF